MTSDNHSIFTATIDNILFSEDKYCIVKAGTGTGKTTTLPCELCTRDEKFKICVVLPTREAVYNAYDRVLKNNVKSVNVNFSVGYAANSDIHYNNNKISHIRSTLYPNEDYISDSEDTRLVYCTVGHFFNLIKDVVKYIQNEDITNTRTIGIFNYVFIDEIQVRSMSIDLIDGILKYLLVSFPTKLPCRVICTSATPPKMEKTKVHDVRDLVSHKVQYLYSNFFDETDMSMSRLLDEFGNAIHYSLERVIQSGVDSGIVLCFLPGISQIKKAYKLLTDFNNDNGSKYEIVIAHSSRSKEQMRNEVFTPNSEGKFKIILSTNIAETSITIPNVLIVIDSCIENIRETGANKVIFNKLVPITKDSAEQRAGRTGRTNNGIVLRLISKDKYDKLQQSRERELERLPITNELLDIIDCNIDVRFIFGDINSDIMRTISEKQGDRILSTIKELNYLGLIKKCGEFFNVTKVGRFVSSLMVGTKAGSLIYKAIKAGIDIYPVVILACFIENAEVIFENFKPPHIFTSDVPLATLVLPWLKLCTEYGQIKISLERLKVFCKKYGLNYEGFYDTQRKIIDTLNKINSLGVNVEVFMFEPEDLFFNVKNILNQLYYSYEKRENDDYVSTNHKIKHKPLHLSNEFVRNNSKPQVVTSIFNMLDKNKNRTNMVIWYDSNYIFKNESLVDNPDIDNRIYDEDEDDEETESDDM